VEGANLGVVDTQVLVDEIHGVSVCNLNLTFIEPIAHIISLDECTVALEPFQRGYQTLVTEHEAVNVLASAIVGAYRKKDYDEWGLIL